MAGKDVKTRKAKRATRSLGHDDARALADDNARLAGTLQKSAESDAKSAAPVDRLSYALVITNNHYRAQSSEDFAASIRESLDEPFEIQNMIWALNTVDGPWATAHSAGAFRWLPAVAADLAPLAIVGDFVGLVYLHLTPSTKIGAEGPQ